MRTTRPRAAAAGRRSGLYEPPWRLASRGWGIILLLVLLVPAGCSPDTGRSLFSPPGPPDRAITGQITRITFSTGEDSEPDWSPDGKWIAYASRGYQTETLGQVTINVIPSGGGVARAISPLFSRIDESQSPSWSPEGAEIAYVSRRGLNFTKPLPTALSLLDPFPSGDPVWRDLEEGLYQPGRLAWSPDGKELAYSDVFGIWVVTPADTSRAPEMIYGAQRGHSPTYSPDGAWVVFVHRGNIKRVPRSGALPEFLTKGEDPDWSPDGRFLAYVLEGNIRLLDLETGEVLGATTEGGAHPSWSPDGRRIAYDWWRGANQDAYVLDLTLPAARVDTARRSE